LIDTDFALLIELGFNDRSQREGEICILTFLPKHYKLNQNHQCTTDET